MRITSISVEVRETVSLPGYCNATRGVTLTADVYEGDVYDADLHSLTCIAEEKVHGELDAILEAADEPPKFFEGKRFDVLVSSRLRGVAAVPTGLDADGSWGLVRRGFTETKAKAFAEKYAAERGYPVMMWNQGEGLPALAEREMTGNHDTGPEPDYCEDCHEAISDLDPSHVLCDDCYRPEEEAQVYPGDDPICPKCDPNADIGRGHALCYAHTTRTDKELEEECGF